MSLEAATVLILARVIVQTLALAALFIWAGVPLMHRCFRTEIDRPLPLSFVYGGGFFLGMCVFFISFVFLSRAIHGALLGFWLSVGGLIAVPFMFRARDAARAPWQAHVRLVAAMFAVSAVMAVTNTTCWLLPGKIQGASNPPVVMQHFGSIHSGRYANYAIYIADHDRIPRLSQNMGQSMLTACHLFLGSNSPLVGLATWVPAALSAFATLIFGFLRWNGLSNQWALGGTFFVFYCNIAISLTAAFVFDNGCPLGFFGYTDIITSAATFLLACAWFRTLMLDPGPVRTILFPCLLGFCWCWCAPQNVVILAVAAGVIGLVALWRQAEMRALRLRRFVTVGLVFVAAVAVGRSKTGAMLPHAKAENIGSIVFVPQSGLRVRPYIMYFWEVWRQGRCNLPRQPMGGLESDYYHYTYEEAKPQGTAAVVTRFATLIAQHFADSIRIYGFAFLGLALTAWRLRAGHAGDEERERRQVWLWLALIAFLTGFGIVFTFELDTVKWWLTRFLVPGMVVCLTGLVLAVAPAAGQRKSWIRRFAWASLLVIGVYGPAVEFSTLFRQNWIVRGKDDPLGHRLNLMAKATGPFPG
jgi:hypothetical protein